METKLAFLNGLDADIKRSVLGQLRDHWTHSSTAIEGNTLTLAETHFVLTEGLTVKGKPVKDHNEVLGHARAIDLLYSFLQRNLIIEDIFNLHRAVQTDIVIDMMQPVGAWKVEANGTYGINSEGKRIFIEYADPIDVDTLMQEWIKELNESARDESIGVLIEKYAKLHVGFAMIHPFFDGNGRLARLLSNIPLLKAGYPPIVIMNENREEYIQSLNGYSSRVGRLSKSTGVWPSGIESFGEFVGFCKREYKQTQDIIDEAWQVQKSRETVTRTPRP